MNETPRRLALIITICSWCVTPLLGQQTEKPPLHAKHWIAITGKPLAPPPAR